MSAQVIEGRRIRVRGAVQGVGFRPWIYRLARELGLTGTVQNGTAGVCIEAFGPEPELHELLRKIACAPPPAARIDEVISEPIAPKKRASFSIARSKESGDRRLTIPADLATCDDCLREIFDPSDRRYRYAFTNCTNCGPRYTITKAVPYDRATTTMARFEMCEACRAEYEDPTDRRFHAEAIACPRCGPELRLLDRTGALLPVGDPVRGAAMLLYAGSIVAIKGLGGFHLACNAENEAAVFELRRRKNRDHKPFALMVRDLAAAEDIAATGPAERALLTSAKRPIVLLERRGGRISAQVAPDSARLGVMLPYTPLHHLLLEAVRGPLVMTSGNLSDAPMVTRDDEALEQLSGVADAFLLHDRPIEARADDSVATVIGGRPAVFRRARGWVPEPVRVPIRFREPVLAVGGQLKNTFCIGIGEDAFLGPHSGDLDDLGTYEDFAGAIDRLERFLGVSPRILACDLHPAYASTRYARARGGRHIAVQHHHAHVASAIAEHHLKGKVIGVAYDGTGLGTDGTAWGGEILLADLEQYERVATLRPIPLAGGDKAIHEPWRIALAMLDDAFDGAPPLGALALFDQVPHSEVEVVRSMIAQQINSVRAHGAGRWFDGFAALGLARPKAYFEGQLAMAWEQTADRSELGAYPYVIETHAAPMQVDLRPAVREAVRDLLHGASPSLVSMRFHRGLIAATAAAVREVMSLRGEYSAVLTGGCFQNAILAAGLQSILRDVPGTFLHSTVPAGDGGLALGQAAIAAAALAAEARGARCV